MNQYKGTGNTGIQCRGDHFPRHGRLGGEGGILRNACLLPPFIILGPSLGQMETAVDQRMSVAAASP